MKQMHETALRPARIVWDYLQLKHEPVPADVIVAFGTNDLRVARFAARLYREGFGSRLVCTGGMAHQGDLLATNWHRTEAEMYADEAIALGVPRDRILLERRATNTAENVRFTREVLCRNGSHPRGLVLATKPFMQRRVWATMAVEWPGIPASLASEPMTLDEYFTGDLPPEKVIPIMLGDLQRVWIYGRRGWSAPQIVPPEVMEAYREFKALGFTQQLLPED
ncbi:MAG: YdcF family protein [Candidatus Sulfopaludibacter sp.]|nr:YdcF family protein [Candidatus Sulfopaludibacter sp.]